MFLPTNFVIAACWVKSSYINNVKVHQGNCTVLLPEKDLKKSFLYFSKSLELFVISAKVAIALHSILMYFWAAENFEGASEQ